MVVMLYSDKSCEYQAISCIKSLIHKITKDVKILYYTVGFKSDFEFKNLCKVEIPIKPEYPRFHFYKAELSLLTMHMFPGEQYIFTDTDVLFSNRFEFDKVTGIESYPLGSFGPHEYPLAWEKTPSGGEVIFDEQALMRYFNVNGRTQRYLWSCFYSFNPNCKDFFEEYTSMCRNRYLLDRQKIYFPYADETAFNVCLWKREVNKNLGFAFVNTSRYDTVKRVEENLVGLNQHIGNVIDNFGADWEYVDDSRKVLFYHGFKDDASTKVILEYLTHEKQG